MLEMTIGTLAKTAGVGVETIRFYERKGLLRQPEKSDSGFRNYEYGEAARIRFVKRAQELGFTLREVKELLDFQSAERITGSQVKARADAKRLEIRRKISDLRKMEKSLERLSVICGEGPQAIRECRIFECFEVGNVSGGKCCD
jgi:DNA-binding transcriptional MerR regulator